MLKTFYYEERFASDLKTIEAHTRADAIRIITKLNDGVAPFRCWLSTSQKPRQKKCKEISIYEWEEQQHNKQYKLKSHV